MFISPLWNFLKELSNLLNPSHFSMYQFSTAVEQLLLSGGGLERFDMRLLNIYDKYMADDLKQFIKEQGQETRRHFDVVAENLTSEIQTVAEQVAANTEKLVEHDAKFESIGSKLIEHDARFAGIESTLEVMKIDLEFIKNELKQKVNRDEFVALEKRLSMLEIKFNQSR